MGAIDRSSNILYGSSIILDPIDVNQRIAGRVRELRAARGLSLEALSRESGVSRSMISLIERGASSATAVVLEKLATGLGVMLASLFDADSGMSEPQSPLSRRRHQAEWRDPESGYVRRNVSPSGPKLPVQLVEVHFPPGGRVAFESGSRDTRVHQQVWVIEGVIVIAVGAERYRLLEGDCLAIELDRPIMFHNPTRKQTRYAVVIAAEAMPRRP